MNHTHTDKATAHVAENAAENTLQFDPTHLRLSQDFAATLGVKKRLLHVPVRKPHKQEFVRVHTTSEYRLQTAVLEIKEERETYLVAPELWMTLSSEIVAKVLLTTITRQGDVFLWPIRLPDQQGNIDDWNGSALGAASMAEHSWVRVKANMNIGAYDVVEAPGTIAQPVWPDASFQEILQIAFKGRYINSLDHDALRRLRGEA